MKKLSNLKWTPRWVSHLGCIKGCLDYLDIDISDGWLFGGTGHAFIINMSNNEDACPSGPTAWNTTRMSILGKNLGYQLDVLFGNKYEQDLSELQAHAWDFTRSAIDAGHPCYGWELGIPEFYVINGYDDTGYFYSGPGNDEGKGTKPWKELGDTGIGIIEMYRLQRHSSQEDAIIVREAITFALEHAQNPDKWIFPDYRSGLAGFDAWIRAVEKGSAIRMGLAYNAAVWEECRRYGVSFLKEAQVRIGGVQQAIFQDAISQYQTVTGYLKRVVELYPFGDYSEAPIGISEKSQSAADALKSARDAEADGLAALEKIIC